ncbi:Uncharacterized protein dnm_040370 [Desulfonema magnum]|uniref:Uncharacterized protein n=1 Tax=Desulfonema magnum TaxID=45655 RepID=A0A975BLY9_9BACT|nr:Uncharacterized protein dnm_040370 [Desulfonema magnum]
MRSGVKNRKNKYLTINFRYLPGKETRLFSRNDPPPVTEKAGFLPICIRLRS